MGGRGASSGISRDGKIYGTEYHTIFQFENIKFIKTNDEKHNNKAPMETMTKGRIYAYVNPEDELKSITFFDNKNKRNITIDINGRPHKIGGKYVIPHLHIGYIHSEKGTYYINESQQKLVDKVINLWYKFKHK